MPRVGTRNSYREGRLTTVHLLALTSSVQVVSILNVEFFFSTQTSYLSKEVNRTEPSPEPVRVPWLESVQDDRWFNAFPAP
jgi:hypothetical protein